MTTAKSAFQRIDGGDDDWSSPVHLHGRGHGRHTTRRVDGCALSRQIDVSIAHIKSARGVTQTPRPAPTWISTRPRGFEASTISSTIYALYVTARILPVSSHPTRWGQTTAYELAVSTLTFEALQTERAKICLLFSDHMAWQEVVVYRACTVRIAQKAREEIQDEALK